MHSYFIPVVYVHIQTEYGSTVQLKLTVETKISISIKTASGQIENKSHTTLTLCINKKY